MPCRESELLVLHGSRFDVQQQAISVLRRWAYETQHSLEGPLTERGGPSLARWETTFRAAVRHLSGIVTLPPGTVFTAMARLEDGWQTQMAGVPDRFRAGDVDLHEVRQTLLAARSRTHLSSLARSFSMPCML